MSERRAELEMRQAASIVKRHWENAVKRNKLHAAAGVGCALSALMWALGDDDEWAAKFEAKVDGTREDSRDRAERN